MLQMVLLPLLLLPHLRYRLVQLFKEEHQQLVHFDLIHKHPNLKDTMEPNGEQLEVADLLMLTKILT